MTGKSVSGGVRNGEAFAVLSPALLRNRGTGRLGRVGHPRTKKARPGDTREGGWLWGWRARSIRKAAALIGSGAARAMLDQLIRFTGAA